ncbi:MAG: preprotein translocase subunit SecG [Candidatus Levybacteria bacterium RIFCSPLOWO2_02_FULL_36_8b]|nr:MAG: preprotein translocase subunit SecG [Candidatus Levybacteria bacterium RIFCSPLOWO2_02_FULL_36_8b]
MIISVIQTISAVLLIVVILLQMQGSGLSASFGGGGEFYRSKRSVEKLLIWATIALSVMFAVLSVVLLVSHK